MQWCLQQPDAPSVNAKDRDGYTALATAIAHLRFDIAELLIERGTDLTLTLNDGSTVLHSLARLPSSPTTIRLVDMILARKVSLTEVRSTLERGDLMFIVADCGQAGRHSLDGGRRQHERWGDDVLAEARCIGGQGQRVRSYCRT